MNPPPPSGDDTCDHETDARSVDVVLAILQHRYRRAIIEYCRNAERQTAELDDLVEYIVREPDHPDGPDERGRIAAALHHMHLPRLAAEHVIEWDPRSGQVRYRPDDQLETWLTRIHAAMESG